MRTPTGFERARASCSTSYPARMSHSPCSTTTASNGESCGVRLKRMSDRPRLPERHDPKAGLRPEPEHRVSSRVKPNEEVVRPGFRGVRLLDKTCCCPIRAEGGQHGSTRLSGRVSPTS